MVHDPWSLAASQTVSQNRAFDLFADSAKLLIILKVRTQVVPQQGIELAPGHHYFNDLPDLLSWCLENRYQIDTTMQRSNSQEFDLKITLPCRSVDFQKNLSVTDLLRFFLGP